LLDQRRQLAGLGGIEAMVGRSGGARAAGERIVRQARGQLGSAYLWGGEEPGRFDCSGLVQWAVKQATGRTLPRVAADQARVGRPVERGRLQAGDLVFFANTDRPGVSHVGIYAGEGRFIHAASPGKGVITSRLDEPYWASHYQSARRVV
jgi:cell wall-associated NlpC family hydrolase